MPVTIENRPQIDAMRDMSQWQNHVVGESVDASGFQSVKQIQIDTPNKSVSPGSIEDLLNLPQHEIVENLVFNRTIPREEIPQKRELMMYDPEFDRRRAREVRSIIDPQEQRRATELFFMELDLNINTMIAERLHAGMSRIEYTMKDGLIYGLGSDEPSIDIFKRGAAYTKLHGASLSDQGREGIEVDTFENKIQALFADENTPIGTMLLVSSPPGEKGNTRYCHNFNDIWSSNIKNGKKVLELRRYSSALSMEETAERLKEIDPTFEIPEKLTDRFYLKTPLKIIPGHRLKTPDAVQVHLHKEYDPTSLEDFEEITNLLTPNRNEYKAYVLEHPDDIYGINLRYNAIVNKADFIRRNQKRKNEGGSPVVYYAQKSVQNETENFGRQRVREVGGWCGASGGMDIGGSILGMRGGSNPFSVADMGGGVDAELSYECPSCHKTNTRTAGTYDSVCPKCGSDKVAC